MSDTVPSAPIAASAPARSRWRTRLAHSAVAGWLGLAVVAFWAASRCSARALAPHDAGDVVGADVFAPISAAHRLGTDYLGRDMLSRIIDGARYTVGVALRRHAAGQRHRHLLGAAGRGQRAAGSTRSLSRALDTLISIPQQDVRAGDGRRLRLVGAGADR